MRLRDLALRGRRLRQGLRTDRRRPDLAALDAEKDPERFVWAVLPHAARTFAACIAILPEPLDRATAVAYLMCRILDTHEDLAPSTAEGVAALEAFARRQRARLEGAPEVPATPLGGAAGDDPREGVYRLLLERVDRVEAVLDGLPTPLPRLVVELVEEMAAGMIWALRTFEAQDGVLADRAQLDRYADAVLGAPVRFCARAHRAVHGRSPHLPPETSAVLREVGIFLQLANVLRDVEEDLERDIAYVPGLAQAAGLPDAARARAIHDARVRLLEHALDRAGAYARLLDVHPFGARSLSRASVVLMLGLTLRHDEAIARRLGRAVDAPRRPLTRLLGASLPAALSDALARRRIRRWLDRLEALRAPPPQRGGGAVG